MIQNVIGISNTVTVYGNIIQVNSRIDILTETYYSLNLLTLKCFFRQWLINLYIKLDKKYILFVFHLIIPPPTWGLFLYPRMQNAFCKY